MQHATFGLIAGSGALPKNVVDALLKRKIPFLAICIKNNAELGLIQYCMLNASKTVELEITELGKLIHILKEYKISKLILAGGIASRPSLRSLKFDKYSLSALPKLFASLRKGDNSLLSAFINLLESYNIEVIGVHSIIPELLAPVEQLLTKKSPSLKAKKDISVAGDVLNLLSPFDFGQGAVIVNGRLIAVEGPEGTDAMLRRVQEIRSAQKFVNNGGVLVKLTKVKQEKRVDLPTIGLTTIELAYKAGLSGIAVEACKSFILDKEKTIKLADNYGLFIQTIARLE